MRNKRSCFFPLTASSLVRKIEEKAQAAENSTVKSVMPLYCL